MRSKERRVYSKERKNFREYFWNERYLRCHENWLSQGEVIAMLLIRRLGFLRKQGHARFIEVCAGIFVLAVLAEALHHVHVIA